MSLSGDVVATANLRPPIAPFRILFGPRIRPQTLAQQQQSAAKRKATGTGTGGSPTKKRKLGSGKASGLNFLDDNNNGQEAIDPNESFLERRDRIKRQKWKSRQALELAGHPVEILPAVTQKSAAKAIAAVTAVQEVKSDDGGDRDDKGDVAVVSEEKKLAPTYPSSTLFFDLSACDRYHSLERQDADQCKEESDGKRPSHAGKFIWWRTRRQRGEWWRREREYFRGLSGSKLIAALLLFPPAEGKKPVEYLINWYKTYLPDSKELILLQDLKDSSEETSVGQECMDWGTFHEIDGLASFLHHLGNVLDVDIYETTLSPVQLSPDLIKEVLIGEVERVTNRKWRPLTDMDVWGKNMFRDSPDGIGRERLTGIWFAIEIKAPYGARDPEAYKKCKWYYYPQMQLHMAADLRAQFRLEKQPELKYCLLISWGQDRVNVFRVERDPKFWAKTLGKFVDFHWSGVQQRDPQTVIPTKQWVSSLSNYMKRKATEGKSWSFAPVYSKHRAEELEDQEFAKYFPEQHKQEILDNKLAADRQGKTGKEERKAILDNPVLPGMTASDQGGASSSIGGQGRDFADDRSSSHVSEATIKKNTNGGMQASTLLSTGPVVGGAPASLEVGRSCKNQSSSTVMSVDDSDDEEM